MKLETKYNIGDIVPVQMPRGFQGCWAYDKDGDMLVCPLLYSDYLIIKNEVTKNGYVRHTLKLDKIIPICTKEDYKHPHTCLHIETERLDPEKPWAK
jgi:hypothetical protein